MQTVQRWVDSGRLKAWRTPGGHRRVSAEDAERLFTEYEQGGATGDAPEPARAPHVLVVDDQPVELELLAEVVISVLPDAVIHQASNGFEALVLAGRISPDLIITDLQMPGMDGLEMIRQLRATAVRPISIVAVSALRTHQITALGGLPDGVAFLAKPVRSANLAAVLDRK
jgi:excisionase family DNA binding protein